MSLYISLYSSTARARSSVPASSHPNTTTLHVHQLTWQVRSSVWRNDILATACESSIPVFLLLNWMHGCSSGRNRSGVVKFRPTSLENGKGSAVQQNKLTISCLWPALTKVVYYVTYELRGLLGYFPRFGVCGVVIGDNNAHWLKYFGRLQKGCHRECNCRTGKSTAGTIRSNFLDTVGFAVVLEKSRFSTTNSLN